jgi:putative peptidoglycan lipid II flippase
MGPRVLGIFFVQLHFLVNTILASGLNEGSLSALNYAWLLMLLPLGVFAQSVATAAFPTFSAQVAAGNAAEMAATLGRILRTLLFLIVPAAVGLWALRVPLVGALLERGRFDATSTQMVAHALQMYALGLAAHAVLEMVVRAFYALHDTRTPVVVGVAAMALTIALSLWWVGPLGYGGLALANSTATTVEAFALLWLLRRRLGTAAVSGVWARLGWAFARALVAAALMAGIVQGWLWWWNGQPLAAGAFGPWIAAGVGMVVAIAAYAGASILLRSEELRLAASMLLRRR